MDKKTKMQNNQELDGQKSSRKHRPKNLNLFTIRLPINALVSILHRATGCVLFLSLPVILLMMHLSLNSAEHYEMVMKVLHSEGVKLISLGLGWAFFHHFFAGIRHLAMDVHWMTTLMKARFTSKAVLAMGVIATVFLVYKVWW